jgi:hypothetical protein
MLSKCSNPECEIPFNHREGRLIRLSRAPTGDSPRLIKHFWLCGKCAALYFLEHESGTNVKLKLRDRLLIEDSLPPLISAA